MTKNEVINVISENLEIAADTNANLQVVPVGNNEYKVYALCSDGLVEIKPMFKQNENWTNEFETILGDKYTMYFTKNGDDWVFGLYDGSKCIGEKKCHKWYEPDNFVYFADKCITHPDDSNVDCAYMD